MLANDQVYILSLLRRAMGLESEEKSLEDERAVEQMVVRNGILLTVYPLLSDSLKARLQKSYLASIAQLVNQEYEGNRILAALDDAGLDCVGLKGWEIRRMYPRANMRQMADLDILVRNYSYEKIKSLMAELGYASDGESAWKHDNFSKGAVTVEVHKRLTDDSKNIQRWECELWRRAVPTETEHVFRMSAEDFYIFHIVHLYKDFMNGSLGLRRITDTWLLNRQTDLDRTLIRENLGKFGMLTFHDRMVRLGLVMMGEKEMDGDCELLLRHAFKNGIYGTDKSYKAGRIAAMSSSSLKAGKIRSCIAAVFLPIGRMKAQFPVLKKWPVLLPVCWAVRIWDLSHRGNIRNWMERLDYRDISRQDYEEAKAFFHAGGLQ